jgi:hypothetical protein
MDMALLDRAPVRGAAYPIPDAALDDRLGWIGTSGSGKTYNAGGGVERLLETGARVIIVDPLDVWWGLRLTAEGKPSKFTLPIFGGEHGDLPLNENAGKLIGETVAGMAESCIVSLGGLDTKSAERRFMLAFLEAVYRHATNNPVHIVFDEADLWAPQKALEPKLQSLMEQIVRRGRVRGFIPWLITQRPAVLSKDVLSQVDGLVAFKLTASQDRDALGAWIEGQADKQQGKEILGSLPTLQRGQGVVWVPARGVLETVAFPAKSTFDSSRTPSRGETIEKRELKPIDLDMLKGRLASIEEDAKANDPKALQAEVTRLKRELAKAEKVKAAPPQIVHANADEIAAAREAARSEGYSQGVQAAANAIASLGGKPAKVTRSAVATPAVERVPEAPVIAKEGLSKAQQKVLNAVAWWGAFGIDKPKREQVAFIAGYSPTSGGFYNLLGGLRTMGLLDYPSGRLVSLTELGQDRADGPTVEPTREAFHQHVRAKLSGSQLRVFDPILGAWPSEIASDAVAEQAGYSSSSGGFFNLRGSLRTLGLIDYPSGGQCRAEDWLFP